MKITCTEKQVLIIEQCLESCSRMTSGQLNNVVRIIEFLSHKDHGGYAKGMEIEELIKPILFPELHPNASYGVGMKEIGDAQVCYEMYKILQNYRSRNYDNPGVLAHEPLKYSNEPLIKVEQ